MTTIELGYGEGFGHLAFATACEAHDHMERNGIDYRTVSVVSGPDGLWAILGDAGLLAGPDLWEPLFGEWAEAFAA